ncbi:hypothetical protein A3K72_01765 [Candidatus Woesearchaeota archaeon RBG_13_36_6]|nr:MAG: hypothetical protein A3K72_01765 [Candidatus Woesearchaeota archaeon RBG_13_36_6]
MAEDDYDLMPHKEIEKLRSEIQELRKELAQRQAPKSITKETPKKEADVVTKQDISPSIEKLSKSIDSLLELFKLAGEDIKAEEHHQPDNHLNNMNIHLDNLNNKMNILIRHNEEMAKGILVVAEMMKEHLPAINDNTKTTMRQVMQPQMPMPIQRPSRPAQVPKPPRPMFAGPGQSRSPPNFPMQGLDDFQKPVPKKRELLF